MMKKTKKTCEVNPETECEQLSIKLNSKYVFIIYYVIKLANQINMKRGFHWERAAQRRRVKFKF